MEKFENEYMVAYMEGDIFVGEYKSHIKIDLEAAKRVHKFRHEIVQGKKFKLLLIIPTPFEITSEAKEYLVSEECIQNIEKFAFVNQSYFGSLIGSSFLKFMTPKLPTRIFQKKTDAIIWLNL